MAPQRNARVSRVNDSNASDQPQGVRRAERQHRAVLAQLQISGPLPSAAELERYKAIVPDMPERLLANFEKQTDHRIDLEKKVVEGDIRRADLGLKAGWVFAMALLLASVYLIANGHEGIGVTGLLGELAGLGGAFVYADIRRRQERNRKAGN